MTPRIGGYAIDKEDRAFLRSIVREMPLACRSFSVPDMVDPWKIDPDLNPTEDQLQIGACQGNSPSDCVEFCAHIETGSVVQISRMFCYLGSQKMDGISGDNGSTLSGGTKLLKDVGACLESVFPYPQSYPRNGWKAIPQAAWDEAKKFKMNGAIDIKEVGEIRQFIGSGGGLIQIGIPWYSGLEPQNGFITQFAPGSNYGGHAVCFAGYVPDEVVKRKSSAGYWLILKNSWGKRWGINGRAYVSVEAAAAMLKHKFTVMVGRSDLETPRPRPVPVDWTKPDKGMIA